MLHNMFFLCYVIKRVMFMLRYRTCYVYVMLYNMLFYVMLYNMLFYVMLYNMLAFVMLCYTTCNVYVI